MIIKLGLQGTQENPDVFVQVEKCNTDEDKIALFLYLIKNGLMLAPIIKEIEQYIDHDQQQNIIDKLKILNNNIQDDEIFNDAKTPIIGKTDIQ